MRMLPIDNIEEVHLIRFFFFFFGFHPSRLCVNQLALRLGVKLEF
jgi:hypothetical protein